MFITKMKKKDRLWKIFWANLSGIEKCRVLMWRYEPKRSQDQLDLIKKSLRAVAGIVTSPLRQNCDLGRLGISAATAYGESDNLNPYSTTMPGTCGKQVNAFGKVLNTRCNAKTLKSEKYPKIGCHAYYRIDRQAIFIIIGRLEPLKGHNSSFGTQFP